MHHNMEAAGWCEGDFDGDGIATNHGTDRVEIEVRWQQVSDPNVPTNRFAASVSYAATCCLAGRLGGRWIYFRADRTFRIDFDSTARTGRRIGNRRSNPHAKPDRSNRHVHRLGRYWRSSSNLAFGTISAGQHQRTFRQVRRIPRSGFRLTRIC